LNKEEAVKRIAELNTLAHLLVKEAEALAREHKLQFTWDIAHSMGGTYNGDPTDGYYDKVGWNPSAHTC